MMSACRVLDGLLRVVGNNQSQSPCVDQVFQVVSLSQTPTLTPHPLASSVHCCSLPHIEHAWISVQRHEGLY